MITNVRKLFPVLIAAVLAFGGCTAPAGPARTVEDFNFGWRFALGDNPERALPEFDDSGWRELHLPHDWSIEGDFSKDNPATPNGGALPGGTGWYRKHFTTPDSERVHVEFDGVYMNSTVYVNGKEAGTRPFGYASFSYDITPLLNPAGADNVMAVRCDNSLQPNSRWYTGSGIYRNVRLVCTSGIHIAYNGIFVTTPEVSRDEATVRVETEVSAPEGTEYEIRNIVLDPKGRRIGEDDGDGTVSIRKPELWSTEHPHLYTLVTEIVSGGVTVDSRETRFGIRHIAWDKDRGFLLNGSPVKLLGVCMHHDMGCLGTAVHRRALERQLEILKGMGVNAIRTSHNPPAPELLDLCDEMGVLVMDEAFDAWTRHKAPYDYASLFEEWHERDLADLVRRDRNHPSVILWSIGNEIPEQHNPRPSDAAPSRAVAAELAAIVRKLDPTRAVTAGCNHVGSDNNVIIGGELDVIGLNYHDYGYDSLRLWFPDKPIIASETASALNSRGVYYQPSTEMWTLPDWSGKRRVPVDWQCTGYDMCHAFWETTCTHQDAWKAVRDHDFVAGAFVWTGFDYLGEPTAFGWPARSSYFGIVDLAGFPKDQYYMYRAEWTDETTLHLLPHWNWQPGERIDVWAYYNNADEVELFLNGRSLGCSSKNSDRLHAFWPGVEFEPGELTAVSRRDGREVARETVRTAGPACSLRLTADRKVIGADGYDLSFITVEAVDKDGIAVPTAGFMLDFRVEGPGELFGTDNGNAADTLSLKAPRRSMFSGKALAVIRSVKDTPGTVTLHVGSELGPASIDIKTR